MIGVHSQIVTLLFFFNFTAYYIVRGLDLQAILMFMNNVVTYVFYFTSVDPLGVSRPILCIEQRPGFSITFFSIQWYKDCP